MARYYQNDNLYSNSTRSSRNGGGTWVYINGELYHAGVKGMQWGKHLPGTDWWKESVEANIHNMKPGQVNYGNGRVATTKWTSGNRVRANLQTAGQAAKLYGGYVKNNARVLAAQGKRKVEYMGRQIKSAVSNISPAIKKAVLDYFRSSPPAMTKETRLFGTTHIGDLAKQQGQEAIDAYTKAAINGGLGNILNSFIQTSQYRIVVGVNNFLESKNLSGKVDTFLSKFFNKKSSRMQAWGRPHN